MYWAILMPKMQWCCITKFLFSVNQKQIGALVSHFLFHFSHHCLTRVCSIGLCLVSYASLNIATRERLHISIWNQYVQRIFCRLLLSFFRSSKCHFFNCHYIFYNAVIGRSVLSIFVENLYVHNPLDFSFAQSTTKSLNNDKILLHRAMAKGQFMSIYLKEHNCLNMIYNVWSTWLRCSSNCLLYLHVSFSIFLYHPVSSLIFWHLTSLSSVFFFT